MKSATTTQSLNIEYIDKLDKEPAIVFWLKRFNQDNHGTNGTLVVKHTGVEVCKTIELPWKNNQRRISCIPTGRYELAKRYSQKFKHHIYVKDVEGRSFILFHPANNALKELNGCIAPVSTHQNGRTGIGWQSRKAFEKLLHMVYASIDMGYKVELIIENRFTV